MSDVIPPPASPPASRGAEHAFINVLLVEDHRLVSEALGLALAGASDIRVTGLAGTVREMTEMLRREPADVVLMDFHLPDGDGITAASKVMAIYPNTRVVMVTADEDRELIVRALEIGCVGFVGKSESLVHLPSAVRSAAGGTTAFSPGIAAKLLARTPGRGSAEPTLTDREFDVLQLLAQGLSTQDIADKLFISPNTLRNHFNRINEKLDTHSKLEAVSKALRTGLIALTPDAPAGTLADAERRGG